MLLNGRAHASYVWALSWITESQKYKIFKTQQISFGSHWKPSLTVELFKYPQSSSLLLVQKEWMTANNKAFCWAPEAELGKIGF